jgi:concanavalin A-like lectin/glucanase superfamily protein
MRSDHIANLGVSLKDSRAMRVSFCLTRRLGPLLCLVCCLVAVPATAGTAEAAGPLIAQWPLSESSVSGGVEYTPDVSGNGLALSAAPGSMHFETAEGKFGGYLAGASSANLQVNSPLLAPQQLTLLAWIKQNGYPGALRYIAGRGDDGPTCLGSSYALYTGYPGKEGLHFYIRQPGPGAPSVLSESPPNSSVFDGQWHLVAGTFDGSNMRFYVDGNQIGPAMPGTGISYEAPITDSPFYVDGYPPQAGCFGFPAFPGGIDEVRVYNRALSQTELARLAAAPGPNAPDLVPDEGASPTPIGPTPVRTPVSISLGRIPSSKVTGYSVLHLDTIGPVTETKIKIDGSNALHVSPSSPYVGLNLGAGAHQVTATAIGSNGTTASTSTTVTGSSGSLKRPAWMPDVATASSEASLLLEALKNSECVPNSMVVFGIVETEGCFRKIDPATELPKSEQAVANEYVAINFFIEHAGPLPCLREDPTCHRSITETFRNNPAIEPFASPKRVKINGLYVEPVGGASVIVFPAIKRVVCSNCSMYYEGAGLGKIPVQGTGKVNLDLSSNILHLSDGSEKIKLFSFDTSKAFHDIGGFPINGQIEIAFQKKEENRTTALKLNLSLPEELVGAAGFNPTSRVEINADNKRGTYLGELNIHVAEAFLGPVEIANVDFTYKDGGEPSENCPRKWWKATAEVFFVPGEGGGGVRMAPEPRRNGIAFCAGEFASAGAELIFGEPPGFLPAPEIFPGVTLNKIGFGIQLREPILFEGHAEIRSGEIVHATGGFLAAFASPSAPYTFAGGDAGGSLPLLKGQTFTSTTVAIGGKVDVVPTDGVSLELGSAYLLYSYPDYISARGSAHLQTYLFTVRAEGNFEMSTATRKFNAGVKGEICLVGGIEVEHVGLCAGGEGHISSRGMSVCFNIGNGTWTPGVGVLYSNPIPEFFAGALGDGCKPSHFWEANVRARPFVGPARGAAHASSAAGGALQFTVKPGEEDKTVELTGAGGAPVVTVVAPGGEQLTSRPNVMLHTPHLGAISYDKYSRTWITIEGAKPGVYKVTAQPGSPPISGAQETRYEPRAEVKASVTGKGRKLVLHYDAGHAAGQTVSFFERGKDTWKLLKKVSGGKGQIAFEPSYGPAGKRSVAAQVEVDGVPGALQTLDHFKAPPPPTVGRVAGVKVVHHGGSLAVSWRKSPYAQGYSVVTDPDGGAVHMLKVKAGRSGAKVKNVPATEGGTVAVVALGVGGERGKPGKARFAALRKAKTRLLPYKELGEGISKKSTGNGKHAKGKKGAKS